MYKAVNGLASLPTLLAGSVPSRCKVTNHGALPVWASRLGQLEPIICRPRAVCLTRSRWNKSCSELDRMTHGHTDAFRLTNTVQTKAMRNTLMMFLS